jgi:AcrR family transcriptional regulator
MTREKSGAVTSRQARTELTAAVEIAAPGKQPPMPGAPDCPPAVAISGPRQPRQERGERRVCTILDAAAELITECGAEGLTVQALAERAQTSKGSLYHFFPDLQSVVRALADRHRAGITRLTQAMIADVETDWAALTLDETVERFIAPLAYLAAHPDLLALARAPNMLDNTTRRLSPICDLADHILRRRYPRLTEQERLLRASTMVAVMDGIVGYSLRSNELEPGRMVGELRRVLAAYLGSHEKASAGIHG